MARRPVPTRRRGRARARGERGVVLLITALMLAPMLTFVAYGVDLAGWYSRIGELQRSADAAALAGTVWMPNLTKARSAATDTLARNGIVHGQDDVTVEIVAGASPTSLRVEITDHDAERFFSNPLDGDQVLTRAAEAEYYLPLPLGSPLNYFGGDASKTAVADVTTHSVSWPIPYGSVSRAPVWTTACNVGTAAAQNLGRWTSATTYNPTAYSGTTRCSWTAVRASTSPTPTTQVPTNAPCNVVQSPSTTLGTWVSILGAVPTYNPNARSSGSGNVQCTWSVPGTEPADASTRPPVNSPCNVTGQLSAGSWNLAVVFLPLTLLAAPPCRWTASVVTTVTQTPNPIAADRSPGFWAQVEGPGTVTAYGDAYSSGCTTALNCTTPESPQWRDTGYWYVIQVPETGVEPFTVSVFDAGFRRDGVITEGTGDFNLGDASLSANPVFNTEYRVYRQTNTLDVSARVPVGGTLLPDQADGSCWWSVGDVPAFDLTWRPLCTISPQPGERYLLNVRTSSPGPRPGAGLNGYAVQAVSTGTAQPSLFAYADMGMFNNGSGTFYLTEVAPHFAGKMLDIDLWDPGDVNTGTATISPRMPSLVAPRPVRDVPPTCTYTASPDPNPVSTTSGAWGSTGVRYLTARPSDSATKCAVNTAPTGTPRRFNDEWLRIRIQIPTDYTCTLGLNPETTPGSCWWGIAYEFSAQPYDVTTWKARIEGNPVHLTS